MAKKRNPGSRKPGVKRKRAQPGASASNQADAKAAGGENAAVIEGRPEEPKKKNSVGPLEFLQQVRSEGEKVTWTSRNETTVSTIMVLIMVAIMSLFFFLVDQALNVIISALLSLGG